MSFHRGREAQQSYGRAQDTIPGARNAQDGCAHALADRGSLKPDLCLQHDSQVRALSSKKGPISKASGWGKSFQENGPRIPRNGTSPRAEMPRREGLAFQDVDGIRV